MYTLPHFFIFLITIMLITGCSQRDQTVNQNNTNQNIKNIEIKEKDKVSVEQSTTKPLQGTINGESFQLDKALFKLGVDTLTLKQGEKFFPELGIKIFFFRENSSQLPIGQHIKSNCRENSNSGTTTHLYMMWKPQNSESIKQKAITCGYNLDLKFAGRKGDDVIPATLKLKSENFGINLSGSFDVKIEN